MGYDSSAAGREPDVLRALVPVIACVVAVVAAVSDPSGWAAAVLLVPLVVLVVWSRWGLPAPIVTAGVVVPAVVAQWPGELEPSMFLVSLLALVVTGWERLTPTVGGLLLLMIISPVAVAFLPEHGDMAWGLWMIGVAFPAFIGAASHRQRELTAQLEHTRRELVEQEGREERRRIARDVHDLVGHGLAAMMLQVTSARHVLRKDPDSAEEALDEAQKVGRQSMQELRRTVSVLRDSDSDAVAAVPSLQQVEGLVDSARAGGLDVDYRLRADGGYDDAHVDQAVGVALYRVAQESLANARRHAPGARTVVTTRVTSAAVELEVSTSGPLDSTGDDDNRPHYGLRGMRERAQGVGGQLEAGPVPGGWRVHCVVPTTAAPNTAPNQAAGEAVSS
ncbi:MAG: sensor histidine kinase [Nocardioidaceae bacterium]